MRPFTVRIRFHGDLCFFLKSKSAQVDRELYERTSVKDVIEACGIPHTEVDLILVNGEPVDFAFLIGSESSIEVYPINANRFTLFPENRLQILDIREFVADGHLGKLVGDLRLLGIDAVYDPAAEDRQLMAISTTRTADGEVL